MHLTDKQSKKKSTFGLAQMHDLRCIENNVCKIKHATMQMCLMLKQLLSRNGTLAAAMCMLREQARRAGQIFPW